MAPGSDGGVATLPMLWNSQPGLAQYQHAIISCDTSCCDSYLDVRHPPTQDIGRFDGERIRNYQATSASILAKTMCSHAYLQLLSFLYRCLWTFWANSSA